MFEADEAKLLEELRNYSQHKFLPYLNPAWQFSQTMPMAEFQFRLHVEPLLKWDSLNAEVRKYLEQQGGSIDRQPIMRRYTKAVRDFYKWLWLKVEEKMQPERIEYDAQVAELMVYGDAVFLTPGWIQKRGGEPPPGWNGARWRRRSLAETRTEHFGPGAEKRSATPKPAIPAARNVAGCS